jgi:hypothetical protein
MSVTALEYLQVLCDALQDVGVECEIIETPELGSLWVLRVEGLENTPEDDYGYVYINLTSQVKLNSTRHFSTDPILFEEE